MAENRKPEIFPIQETNGEARMKNISSNALSHFYGIASKDLNTFMFKYVAFLEPIFTILMSLS